MISSWRNPARRLLASVAATALATTGLVAFASTPAAAAPDPTVTVNGHGWGHGRGMGQYGSLGYALDGWTSAQILDHFYGGTSAGTVDPETWIDVRLLSFDGEATIVGLAEGQMGVAADGVDEPAISSDWVRVTWTADGAVIAGGPSCDGPWTERPVLAADRIEITALNGGGETRDTHLQLCEPDGDRQWVAGEVHAVRNGGAPRTVNALDLEDYLRGVVPLESPAYWGGLGDGAGLAALESQSVAARSYAVGENRYAYAETCDSTSCQVYRGLWRDTGGGPQQQFQAFTDTAIANTSDSVRRWDADGSVARTEFSSSTGGYTAGGVFPAVPDAGDATPSNPNHDWTVELDLASWAASQGLGDLLDIEVTGRNGLGEDGGRATEVTATFSNGSRVLTGNQFRLAFGLRSDWFSFGPLGGETAEFALHEEYTAALYQLFLNREATAAELAAGAEESIEGRRGGLTTSLAVGDEWAGVVIDQLYIDALRRPSDAAGRAHWVARIADGARIRDVSIQVFGSAEYLAANNNDPRTYVAALYRDLLGRPADPGGLDAWSEQLISGALSPGEIVAGFVDSYEYRGQRVDLQYDLVLRRAPDAGGREFWITRLLVLDDVRLAAELAASDEYFARVTG